MGTESRNTFAVRCSGLTKTYGTGPSRVVALRGVDLNVLRGEFLMLVGPSGCGKTTLISVISAILEQDDGQCEVLGRDLKAISPGEKRLFRAQSIGFVFQAFNLLPALTALENVAIPLLINGMSREYALEKSRALLDLVGLTTRSEALPGQLSGGQQQRVAIARSLVHDPMLIVCDEPTSNLDHQTGHEMMSILRETAHSHDRTLIVVTHDTRVEEFADRIARMDDGRIVGFTAAEDGE